jgi:hypothetical protein
MPLSHICLTLRTLTFKNKPPQTPKPHCQKQCGFVVFAEGGKALLVYATHFIQLIFSELQIQRLVVCSIWWRVIRLREVK